MSGPRRSRGRAAVGATIGTLLALVLAACSGKGPTATPLSGTGTTKPPPAAGSGSIRPPAEGDAAKSAGASAIVDTLQATLALHVSAGNQTTSFTSTVLVDNKRHLAESTLSGASLKHPLQQISDGTSLYLSIGGQWRKAVLDPTIQPAIDRQVDRSKAIGLLLDQIAGSLKAHGTAEISGTATNRWTGTVPAEHLSDLLDAVGFTAYSGTTSPKNGQFNGTVDAYLDGNNVLRSLRLQVVSSSKDNPGQISVDYEVTAVDQPVSIDVPAANQIDKTVQNASAADIGQLITDLGD